MNLNLHLFRFNRHKQPRDGDPAGSDDRFAKEFISEPADEEPDAPDPAEIFTPDDRENDPAELAELDALDDADFSLDEGESDADFSSGLFINSLDDLAEDDIPLSDTARKAMKTPVSEYIRRVIFWLFFASFVVSTFLLVRNFIQKQQATKIYSQLQEEFFAAGFTFDVSDAFRTDRGKTPGLAEDSEQRTIRTMTELLEGEENDFGEEEEAVTVRSYNAELEKMRAFLQSARRTCPDLYAWINVSGTNINYPITQSEDNSYYLNHAANGDYNPEGSIFADYRNDANVSKNYNTVFYGHNISNGEMFHDVTKFFKDEYFNNLYIYVSTMDGIFVYEPFAVYETAYDSDYFKVRFSSGDDFVAFAEDCQNLSAKSKDFTFTSKDRVLTLSTCTNGYFTQRYALHAKLIKSITD
ncbi:MAG: class B sortase [Clostridia bacterium]|nr:class B sortase [Clostridia bacterium]